MPFLLVPVSELPELIEGNLFIKLVSTGSASFIEQTSILKPPVIEEVDCTFN